ncbi:universal stress protein [Caulobacter sp. ErkDOM-YI]|uniref:universal stress protein n=1 Tax=unclassified Caulobacter TaxID=2648921 RepID=UPI003AF7CB0A
MPPLDILLHLDAYPEVTSTEAIDQAVRFVASVGGVLSAIAVEVDIKPPKNRLANYVIGLSDMAAEEERKSREFCAAALGTFTSKARELGVLGEAIHAKADLYAVAAYVAERSRTRDLCIVPVASQSDGQRAVVEAVAFGSGRPVLTFCPGGADLPPSSPDTVVLAWDGSRTAARAMADAMPILRKAREITVLTVTNDKASTGSGSGRDVMRHLGAHGINAVAEEIDGDGRRIGVVFSDYVAANRPGLFVMGAYGHSRAREFFLGGATEHMLHHVPVPMLLSH